MNVQVSEVLSDKTRLSISGWFHGPPIDRPSPYKELAPIRDPPLPLKVRNLQNMCTYSVLGYLSCTREIWFVS